MKTNGIDERRALILLGMRLQQAVDDILSSATTKSLPQILASQPPSDFSSPPASPKRRGRPPQSKMTAAARARISAAQKARWKTKKQIERGMLPKSAR